MGSTSLRIGLVQMQCEKGAIDDNLRTMAHYLGEAAAKSVDILGFPEMSITGYADPTKQPEAVLCLDGPEVARLLAMTNGRSTTLLAGLIEENPGQKPFITQIAVHEGRLIGHYRKITIEDEEIEWFSPGKGHPLFHHDEIPFGIAICADISNEAIFAASARQGAKIVFELAAPGLYGAQATRNWRSGYAWWEGECQKYLGQFSQTHGCWIGVATQAGRTIDEDFPGGGYLFNPQGERLVATSDWQPGVIYIEIDLQSGQVTPFS
jgi:predicted amidohydrolase